MNDKHYIRPDGTYIGAFCGCAPAEPAVEIPAPPEDGRMRLVDGKWVLNLPAAEQRQIAYRKHGLTAEALVIALWERVVEGRPEASEAIQTIRTSVKTKFPNNL